MSIEGVEIEKLSIGESQSIDQKDPPNVSDRIDVATILCSQCTKNPGEFVCARCSSVYYCGPKCQKAAWKAHKIFCLNHSLIPKEDEIVCQFKEDGVVRNMTQSEFKGRLNATFVKGPIFSEKALESVNKGFNGEVHPLPPIENSVAIYDEPSMGYGIVALRPIPRGTEVCGFGGIVIPIEEWTLEKYSRRQILYSCGGEKFMFDPANYASLGAFANEGLPNGEFSLKSYSTINSGKPQVSLDTIILAIKDIKEGEVIRVDYGPKHAIKNAPYSLDEHSKEELLEKFSLGLGIDLLNTTGWVDSIKNSPSSEVPDRVKALEIEYVLTRPYVLAFLHLKTELDPKQTLNEIEGLRTDVKNGYRSELKNASNILKGLSKIPPEQKEQFLEVANQISQRSLVSLCELIGDLTYSPSIEDCKKLGKALDTLNKKFFGYLDIFAWQTSEKEEFKQQFFKDEHQRSLLDITAIDSLPEEFKNKYALCLMQYSSCIRRYLS